MGDGAVRLQSLYSQLIPCYSAHYSNLMQDFFRVNWHYQMKAHVVVYPRLFYKCQHSGKSEENDSLGYSCRDKCLSWEGAAEIKWKTGNGNSSIGACTVRPLSSSSPYICNCIVITLNLISGPAPCIALIRLF